MEIEEFGNQLLDTLDLDPVYVMLHAAKRRNILDLPQLSRWCLAYWCCYHGGVSSWLAEIPREEFYDKLELVAKDKNYPRGVERRYFRGKLAEALVQDLRAEYTNPEDFVRHVVEVPCFSTITKRVQKQYGFGPWIAFKIADMVDRVFEQPVDITTAKLNIYREPLLGAEMACTYWMVPFDLDYTLDRLKTAVGHHLAPPGFERPVNILELETILCKWKSHKKGHYGMGKDTKELRHALKERCELGDKLMECLP